MIAALLMGAMGWAACDAPSSVEGLEGHLSDARASFLALDEAGFNGATAAVAADVACLREPLSPGLAAEVHTVAALSAFLARDEARTIAAFQAALADDPGLDLSAWLPASHPANLELRLAARLPVEPARHFAPHKDERIWVDGAAERGLVPDQPAVLQREQSGAITDGLLYLGSPLPEWAPLAADRLPPEVRRRMWLGGTGGSVASATIGMLLIAANAHSRYVDPNTAYTDLGRFERTANIASIGAIAGGIATTGLGVALLATW